MGRKGSRESNSSKGTGFSGKGNRNSGHFLENVVDSFKDEAEGIKQDRQQEAVEDINRSEPPGTEGREPPDDPDPCGVGNAAGQDSSGEAESNERGDPANSDNTGDAGEFDEGDGGERDGSGEEDDSDFEGVDHGVGGVGDESEAGGDGYEDADYESVDREAADPGESAEGGERVG